MIAARCAARASLTVNEPGAAASCACPAIGLQELTLPVSGNRGFSQPDVDLGRYDP
ncbi:hypothetical protein [Saccharomonospora xinjiangensis]|uniref:hypothetical protein n=1 Tax=Saccharomonospora xinjiangensis TaxID=75294 RepID=UPI0012FC0C12|nr:hypothetical protein [Saccharomonospora xinjiangensis]